MIFVPVSSAREDEFENVETFALIFCKSLFQVGFSFWAHEKMSIFQTFSLF